MNLPAQSTLPTDPLAALLAFGNEHCAPFDLAQCITSGAWPVDPVYRHEDHTLIELLVRNSSLAKQGPGTIELIGALTRAGVEITSETWRKSTGTASKPVELLLRGIGEGEAVSVMQGACVALEAIRPLKPVVDQVQKVLALIAQAGGWGQPVQGLPLATWLALHDARQASEAGYTEVNETEDENKTRHRVRAKVFGEAVKTIGVSWSAEPLDKMILDWRLSARDAGGNLQTPAASVAWTPGCVQEQLSATASLPPRLQALLAARLLDLVMLSSSVQRTSRWSEILIDESLITPWLPDILACASRILLDDDTIAPTLSGVPISTVIRHAPELVLQLPLNARSARFTVPVLLADNLITAGNACQLGEIVSQWLGADEQLREQVREQTQANIDQNRQRGTAGKNDVHREAFLLSVSTAGAAPLRRPTGLRL